METNLKAIVEGMAAALGQYSPKKGEPALDVDGMDAAFDVKRTPEGLETCTFEMTTMVDAPRPAGASRRGPGGGAPLGILKYEVTVVARWEPFDDE